MIEKLNITPYHPRTCWIYNGNGEMIGRCNNYTEFNRARVEIVKKKLDNCVIVFDNEEGTQEVKIDRFGKVSDWKKFNIYEPDYAILPYFMKLSLQSKGQWDEEIEYIGTT